MRHKEIHIYNVFSAFKYIIDHAKGMVSDKIKRRLNIYVNMKDFVKNFDIKTLPAEMGGTIPMKYVVTYLLILTVMTKKYIRIFQHND